jgi:hypothetical protein
LGKPGNSSHRSGFSQTWSVSCILEKWQSMAKAGFYIIFMNGLLASEYILGLQERKGNTTFTQRPSYIRIAHKIENSYK